MATSYDITVTQGQTTTLNLCLTDSSDVAVNLSGYNVRGKVKYSYGSTGVIYNLNPTVSSEVSGIININISATGSAALPVFKGFYDIERYTAGDDVVNKVLHGNFIVLPEVTT